MLRLWELMVSLLSFLIFFGFCLLWIYLFLEINELCILSHIECVWLMIPLWRGLLDFNVFLLHFSNFLCDLLIACKLVFLLGIV